MNIPDAGTLLISPNLPTSSNAAFLVLVTILICTLIAVYASFRRKIREIRSAGSRDPLTGLMNPIELEGALTSFFQQRPMKDYCLVALDINAFRRFNSMFGYASGDRLLQSVAQCIAEHYLCGTRLNGDIFLFLAPSSYDMISKVEENLGIALYESIGRQYGKMITYKFGVYPLLKDTLKYRDAYDGVLFALKSAKGMSSQREVIYNRNMQRGIEMRKDIELHMYEALAKDEFKMYIQPKFEAATANCCGGEALIRWQSKQMGMMSPGHFIPIFERNGFIAEIDQYMLKSVLTFLQQLLDSGREAYPISVNQSRITVSFPDYLDRLRAIIQRYTVPLRYVEIEITESAFTEDYDSLVTLVQQLKDMGFTVAMDDFGTGYSSLNTLRELPVDILKLDKEFLRESDMSDKGRKIISSVLGMSRDLEIGTVCEGVETGMQLDFLRLAGCDTIQGFFLAKPMPSMEFERRFIGVCAY